MVEKNKNWHSVFAELLRRITSQNRAMRLSTPLNAKLFSLRQFQHTPAFFRRSQFFLSQACIYLGKPLISSEIDQVHTRGHLAAPLKCLRDDARPSGGITNLRRPSVPLREPKNTQLEGRTALRRHLAGSQFFGHPSKCLRGDARGMHGPPEACSASGGA